MPVYLVKTYDVPHRKNEFRNALLQNPKHSCKPMERQKTSALHNSGSDLSLFIHQHQGRGLPHLSWEDAAQPAEAQGRINYQPGIFGG